MNILFVCTANTCRSPMAHGLFEKMVNNKEGIYSINSAGIFTHSGDKINDMACIQLEKHGINFAGRKSVQVTKEIIDIADIIFSMTSNQRRYLIQSFPDSADKIHLLGDYTNRGDDVIDPYGANLKAYDECADNIEEMLNILIDII